MANDLLFHLLTVFCYVGFTSADNTTEQVHFFKKVSSILKENLTQIRLGSISKIPPAICSLSPRPNLNNRRSSHYRRRSANSSHIHIPIPLAPRSSQLCSADFRGYDIVDLTCCNSTRRALRNRN